MVEEGSKKPFEINGVLVEKNGPVHGVYNIPSDDESPFILSVFYLTGDAVLGVEDMTMKTGVFFLNGMRFRTSAGGGDFPLIANELNILMKSFLDHRGKIPPGYKERERFIDTGKPRSTTTIRVGKKPSESKFVITNIPADDQDDGNDTQFMDIEVENNGDVQLTRRDTTRNQKATMTFKTAKNGGKFPIMAEVFTQIAKGMADTEKLRGKRT